MFTSLCIALAAILAQAPQDLLVNGGFEKLREQRPDRWDVFVAPFPQASVSPAVPTARISTETHAGEYCAVLETPVPYPIEPYNNWSQNILGAYSGKRMRVSGWVKTENADGAALWVQCWQRTPLSVNHVANTGEESPIFGTTEWQEVSLEFEVPERTSFLTLRCVLRGAGKAWFDDVRLEEVKPEPVPEKSPEQELPTPPTLPEVEAKEEAPAPEPEPESAPVPEPVVEETPPAEMVEVTPEELEPSPETEAIEAEIARLRSQNDQLNSTLGSMQTDNQILLEQLSTLQTQLRTLQEAIAPAVPPKPEGTPPLVPLDYGEESP